jgi:hypothetical protein
VVAAQVVARVLRLVGLDRTVSVYPSLDAAVAARLPAAAGARAEDRPGRGSGNIAAAQQAQLRMLEGVIAGLSHAELSLQAALDLPADPARKRIEEALDDLDGIIRDIRGTVSAAAATQLRPALLAVTDEEVANQLVLRWPARAQRERGDTGRRSR